MRISDLGFDYWCLRLAYVAVIAVAISKCTLSLLPSISIVYSKTDSNITILGIFSVSLNMILFLSWKKRYVDVCVANFRFITIYLVVRKII